MRLADVRVLIVAVVLRVRVNVAIVTCVADGRRVAVVECMRLGYGNLIEEHARRAVGRNVREIVACAARLYLHLDRSFRFRFRLYSITLDARR